MGRNSRRPFTAAELDRMVHGRRIGRKTVIIVLLIAGGIFCLLMAGGS